MVIAIIGHYYDYANEGRSLPLSGAQWATGRGLDL